MVEVLIPASPEPLTGYQVQNLFLDWEHKRIVVCVRTPAGMLVGRKYNGAKAAAMMKALNTADLGSKSLHRRILEALSSDGLIPSGSILGEPE